MTTPPPASIASTTTKSRSPSPSSRDQSSSPQRKRHKPSESRRDYVQKYFQQYPSRSWSLAAFENYCHQSEFDGWCASNINGFWLEFLVIYQKSGTAEEQSKATKLLNNYRRRRKPKRQSFTINAQVSGGGTLVGINDGVMNGVGIPASPSSHNEPNHDEPTPVDSQPVFWPPSNLPSTTLFEDGSSVESWLDKLPLSSYVSSSRVKVIDLDAHAFMGFPQQRKQLRALMPQMPELSELVKFTMKRFDGTAADMSSYVIITETSPRPPDRPPSPETYVCTYLNTAISHLLTLIETYTRAQCLHAHVKEGSLDIIWGSIIDKLWQGGTMPCLHLARKELSSFIPNLNCRFDGLFRYLDDSQAFDVGVAEIARTPSNRNNDVKGEYDLGKVVNAMVGLLGVLAEKMLWDWEGVRKLQVFGFITSGWTLTIYRMSFCTPNSFLLRRSETFTLKFNLQDLPSVFHLLETLTRVKDAMCDTVGLVLRKRRRSSF